MNAKYLIAAAVLWASSSSLAAQSVKAGIEAWQRGDYAAAVAIWKPLAESGDADASFNLGQAYRLGRGVPTNVAAAKTWFERAAEKGNLDAQTTLGLLLFQNGDQAEGLRWLKGAADKDEPRALLVYGTALVNGDGVPQDPVLGYAYVSRAAALGLAPAKQTLKQLDGMLSAQDRKKGLAIAQAKPKPASPRKSKGTTVASIAPQRPVTKPVAPTRPAVPPRTSPTASGAWRIQLGAFSQRSSAEALYRRVSAKGAVAGRSAFYVSAGPVIRLQVGPFESRAAAQAACAALRPQACFPMTAK